MTQAILSEHTYVPDCFKKTQKGLCSRCL